jgi:hypothetical protein
MNVARSGKKVVVSGTADSTNSTGSSAALADGAAAGLGEVSMALCFMALDDDVPTTALSSLQSLPFLHDVARIQLQ